MICDKVFKKINEEQILFVERKNSYIGSGFWYEFSVRTEAGGCVEIYQGKDHEDIIDYVIRVDERLKIEIVSRQVHDEPFWRYLVEIEWNFQCQPKVSKKEITGKEFWEWVKTGGNLKKDESQNMSEADREREVILKFSGMCIGETESLSCSSEGITKVRSGCGMFYRTSKKVSEIVEHMGKKYRVLDNSFYSPPDYEVETSDKHTLTLVEI